MLLPSSHDAQVEWFHSLAALPEAELQAASPFYQTAFSEFVAKHLPGYSPPSQVSPQDFAAAVASLRANERSWNQALQAALIQADDHSKDHEPSQAVQVLLDFAAQCPWALFREVAINQSSFYRSTC